jgi:uncharacterized protein with GYD domain
MTTFFMFGTYTTEAIKEISIRRTEKVIETIQQLGGNVTGMYALLGEFDLMFCVNLPDVETAMKASLEMTRLSGISFSTCPAVKVETFDRLATLK